MERDVGPLAWLDAPDQFPDYVIPSHLAEDAKMIPYFGGGKQAAILRQS